MKISCILGLIPQNRLKLVLAILLGFATPSLGNNEIDSSQTNEEDVAEFLWAATESNFEKLKSGVYRATGFFAYRKGHMRLESTSEETLVKDRFNREFGWQKETIRELTFFSAFDFSQGLYRIDRTEPQRDSARDPGHSRKEKANDKEADRQWTTYQWVQTVEKSIRSNQNVQPGGGATAVIDIVKPRITTVFQPFIDVRSLPLISYNGIERLGFPYEKALTLHEEDMLANVVREDDEPYQLVYHGNKNEVDEDLIESHWFDPHQGFMLVRRQLRWDAPGSSEQPYEWTETQWTEVGGVWLPRTYHAVRNFGSNQEELSLAFEWESVNEPIDPKRFTVEGLGLPKGTIVLDAKSSPDDPVHLRTIGVKPRFTEVPIERIPNTESSRFRLWLIIANVVVLAVIAIFVVWRWRVRQVRGNHD